MKVTVFGATGVVGRALLPLLADHEVTAVSHSAREDAGARWVVADAATGDGVAKALEGANVAYYLVHSLGSSDFEEQDRAAAENVAREAASAGVEQIVYLGGLGADDPEASPHLRSRRETGALMVALADGRYAVSGEGVLAIGGRRALAAWCERRADRDGVDDAERAWWQEVTGALIARGHP